MLNYYLRDCHLRNLREQRIQRPQRVPRVIFPRVEPTEFLTDAVFKRHFRFDKRNVERIADMLDLEHPNNRGNPLTPIQAEMGIQDDQKQ